MWGSRPAILTVAPGEAANHGEEVRKTKKTGSVIDVKTRQARPWL
jgi:hypothetical protein